MTKKTRAEWLKIKERLKKDPTTWTLEDDTTNPLVKGFYSCPDAEIFHLPKPGNVSVATGISKTHSQVRCPSCGYFSRWEPKPSPQVYLPES